MNNMMILMIGSFDSSAHTLTSALHFLHSYPDVRKKLTEEIKKVIKSEKDMTKEVIDNIEYLSYFIQEVMR